ncbi:hypothetical protein [uncultured Mediterranean phage uvMED]|nr:hypothetical protein [uncultured Mediterranean phage uvMED]
MTAYNKIIELKVKHLNHLSVGQMTDAVMDKLDEDVLKVIEQDQILRYVFLLGKQEQARSTTTKLKELQHENET